MSCALWLAAVSFDDWRGDEKLALTVFVLALAFLGWAFSFTAAEGAGDHCEMEARSLFSQRAFDWLDETLGRHAGDQPR